LPLSKENYTAYQKIDEMILRIRFIENMVRANICLFTKSIGLNTEREITCMITELEEKATEKYKNHIFASFDIKFRTNVSLPNYIGLGIGVSHGFGTVAKATQVRRQKNN
jgi:hypothetical protein